MGKYDEEKIMLLEMQRWFDKPAEEIIKDAIRNEYEAFVLTKTVYETFRKLSEDGQL